MFGFKEKQRIAAAVEAIIKEINHPEMDNENIKFHLHVSGKEAWSWADVTENRDNHAPQNPWSEIAQERLKK